MTFGELFCLIAGQNLVWALVAWRNRDPWVSAANGVSVILFVVYLLTRTR